MSEGDYIADGEKYYVVVLPPSAVEDIRERGQMSEPMPRNVAISKADLEAHGYTVGCLGCKAILKGTSRQGHSQTCRSRFNEVFKGTDKYQKALVRCDAFAERAMQEEDDRKKRRLDAGGVPPEVEAGEGQTKTRNVFRRAAGRGKQKQGTPVSCGSEFVDIGGNETDADGD